MASTSLLSISLTPGMEAVLKIPSMVEEGSYPNGEFPSPFNTKMINGSHKTLTRGYVVENDAVGRLEIVDNDPIAVMYIHEKPHPNRIFYYPIVNEDVYIVSIVSVPIHDHSSITQGGPAYGTYYTGYTAEEEENL